MKKSKILHKRISLAMALILFILLIPSRSTMSQEFVGTTGVGIWVGGWTGADGTSTDTIRIPPISVNGVVAYCLQHPRDFPVNFKYNAPQVTQDNIYKGCLTLGYPLDILGLKAKYGLDDTTARQYTQYAIWQLTYYFNNEKIRRHPYTDEIMSRVTRGDYGAYTNIHFSIKNPELTITHKGDYQESNLIETTGSPGKFVFPSNNNYWSVDVNGNSRQTFDIGESFRVRGDKRYTGNFDISIPAKLKDPTAIVYISPNTSIQDLGGSEMREKDASANVRGVFKSTGKMSLSKVDERGAKLAGVKFGIYTDEAASNLVVEGITDAEGILNLSDLIVGKYYIKELAVPKGYTLSKEIKAVDIMTDTVATVSWENKIIKGNANLLKIDSGNGSGLANVLFKIKSLSGFDSGKVWDLESDSNGVVKLDNLVFGEYQVEEIKTVDGFILNNNPIRFTIANDGETIQLKMNNDRIKGTLKMLKVDSVSGEKLAGATFRITCTSGFDQGKTWDLTSDSNGYISLENVQYGYYTIQEIKTVEGYVIQPEMLQFRIDENNETIELKMTNDRVIGTVELIKIDTTSGKPLANADFLVECVSGFSRGSSYNLKSDENGIIKTKLEYGRYVIKEVKAPSGYVLNNEPIAFEITENGQKIELKMNDDRIKGNVQLIKIDTKTGKPLANADFTITCKDGFDKGKTFNLTSDENGIIRAELLYGEYDIVEVKAPTGYILNNETIPFTINANGQQIELKMNNDRIKGTVHLIKIDTKTGKPLPNADFVIECLEGFLKGEKFNLTSNEKGIINAELEFGKYQILEVKAVEGYVLNTEPIPFEITENGQKINLKMTNDRIRGIVELIKIDTETGKPLANADFKIKCLEGFYPGNLIDLRSDENGIIKADLVYGKYEIYEVKAPSGFILNNEPIPFEINENGQKIQLSMNNDRIKGSLKIVKVDKDTKKPLSNVKFKVTCLEGFLQGQSFEYITDYDGNINVEKLQYGKYTISEIQTIDGYIIDTTPREFEIRNSTDVIELVFENKIYTGMVVLKKLDEDTNEPLQGIKFELYKGDYLVGEYVTDENGEIKVENLSFGQYYFKEIATIEGYVLDNVSFWNFGIIEDKQEITITAKNRKIKSKVEFSKLDSYTGTLLPGAKMLIRSLDPNNDTHIEFTTESQPSIFELPYGNYEIIELEAPEGYVLNSTPIQVSIVEDDQSIVASLDNTAISYGK